MVVPLAFPLSFLLLNPLVLSEVASPAPVLRHVGIRETHVHVHVHVHVRVRVRVHTRTGRAAAHTGFVARPLSPLRCVPRPRRLPFGRRTGQINRAVCACT